jgi:mRNA-degrading endonuclease toxin of MazEF toxin-antitoxin module
MFKNFLNWISLKEKLHKSNHKPPYFKEREIWWCSIGENIGNEINGKDVLFTRPVLIIRKLDKYSFLGLPLTSNLKKVGTWYTSITHGDNTSNVVLSQIRNFDYRRLDKIMATLDENDFDKVVDNVILLLRSNKPPQSGGRGKLPNIPQL